MLRQSGAVLYQAIECLRGRQLANRMRELGCLQLGQAAGKLVDHDCIYLLVIAITWSRPRLCELVLVPAHVLAPRRCVPSFLRSTRDAAGSGPATKVRGLIVAVFDVMKVLLFFQSVEALEGTFMRTTYEFPTIDRTNRQAYENFKIGRTSFDPYRPPGIWAVMPTASFTSLASNR